VFLFTAASARSLSSAACLFCIVSSQLLRKRFCKTSCIGVDGLLQQLIKTNKGSVFLPIGVTEYHIIRKASCFF